MKCSLLALMGNMVKHAQQRHGRERDAILREARQQFELFRCWAERLEIEYVFDDLRQAVLAGFPSDEYTQMDRAVIAAELDRLAEVYSLGLRSPEGLAPLQRAKDFSEPSS